MKMLKYIILSFLIISCLTKVDKEKKVKKDKPEQAQSNEPSKEKTCDGFIQLDDFTIADMKKAKGPNGICVEECGESHPSEILLDIRKKEGNAEHRSERIRTRFCVPEGVTIPSEKLKEMCENEERSEGEGEGEGEIEGEIEECTVEKRDPPKEHKCLGDATQMQLSGYSLDNFTTAHDNIKGKCMKTCHLDYPNQLIIHVKFKDQSKHTQEMHFCTNQELELTAEELAALCAQVDDVMEDSTMEAADNGCSAIFKEAANTEETDHSSTIVLSMGSTIFLLTFAIAN